MVNPVTVNAGIIVPLTGADVDLWGTLDVNPNMVAIDGLFCGVQAVAVTNVPVTLTSPAGFVPTPSPGPTQSQNRVLRFTGVMTGDVRVTLPIPGVYVIDNRTTGNFVLSFQGVTATEVVAVEQGGCTEIYNDGVNVRFINLGRVGELEFWGGIIAMPAWVAQCTVKPYLWADGTIYNFTDFPALAAKYVGSFGGNGITTFAVQDLSGRLPLAYDKTGARITTAGCGINGQTMGASADNQSVTLTAPQLPANIPNSAVSVTTTTPAGTYKAGTTTTGITAGGGTTAPIGNADPNYNSATATTVTINPGGGSSHLNVQPSQVSGIWVVKT